MYIIPIIGKGCLKITFLMLNGFCFLVAIGFIISSIENIANTKQYGDDSSVGARVYYVIIITIGLLTLVIAGFGSIAALKGNMKTLHTYAAILMIMIGLEIMILFYTGEQQRKLELRIPKFMRQNFYPNTTDMDVVAHDKFWDTVQSMYKCCGLNGPDDYMTLGKEISVSCCQQAYDTGITNDQDQLYSICLETASYYNVGCEKQFLLLVKSDGDWFGLCIIMTVWVQAIEMFLAVLVFDNETNEELQRKLIGYD